MKTGPIVLLEDDADDKDLMEHILNSLEVANKLVWFDSCLDAWDYLCSTPDNPFLILSDINLPKQTGLEFKKRIDADPQLRRKSIPFIFYSTSASQSEVNQAYTEMTVQGYFLKKSSYEDIKKDLRIIIDYWKACRHPNTH